MSTATWSDIISAASAADFTVSDSPFAQASSTPLILASHSPFSSTTALRIERIVLEVYTRKVFSTNTDSATLRNISAVRSFCLVTYLSASLNRCFISASPRFP